ncbi:Starch-binding associating with outer membrane [Parapedobacter composti]|uniref:Starch-binding associating with outer membrane n=1 Tax=Parapedobacter composti TaxID=623281 RepID=A0A1I1DZQ9_9SPHI|nr:RagB/SusD family nutrient uptake outer membrane protein [Parapedobacter composti]SFB78180.1 Starch-binding associating with outer membrane [Parapedobacter composti]
MKKYSNHLFLLAVTVAAGACSDSFLDIKPRGTDLEANYYQNQQEAFNGLVAIYDVVGWQSANYVSKLTFLMPASDDHYAGGGPGGTDQPQLQVVSDYTLTPDLGPQEELWRKGYSGIFRANILLQKLPDIPMDEGLKRRYTAEAKALRAYFYFDLVRFFKNIPLLTEPVPADQMYNVLQAPPEDVYARIEQDLTEAIPDLPPTIPVATEGGRLTQGAARALLGRVYLQLERFEPAAQQLAEVNGEPGGTSQYGYRLLDNFGDLFEVDNKFNSESIFEISHTNTSIGDWACIPCTEGNILNIMSGPRGYTPNPGAPDYVSGWGFFPLTTNLVDLMRDDPRYPHTVADMNSLLENGIIANYESGHMNTGYFIEKYAGREKDRWTGAGSPELNFPQNTYEIRLADTYLMEAEALVRGGGNITRAANLLNAVRDRVGLGPVAATMDNIKRERRIELVGEGQRWFDLIRWGDAPAALGWKGFVDGKHEILPIPLLELENTALEQSREWGGTK